MKAHGAAGVGARMRILPVVLIGLMLSVDVAKADDKCPYEAPPSKWAACVFTLSGAEPAESLVAQGRQFIRISYARNRDLLVLELLHTSKGPAVLVLRDVNGVRPALVTQLQEPQWLAFVRRWKTLVDDNAAAKKVQAAKREEDERSGTVMVCLHPPYVVMQAGLETEIAAVYGDGCDDSAIIDYAYDVAEVALSAEPDCVLLSEKHFRDAPERLSACLIFSGNRQTAAQVYDQVIVLERNPAELAKFIALDGVVKLGNRPLVHGADAIKRVWLDVMDHSRYPFVSIDSVYGLIDSTIVRGYVVRDRKDHSGEVDRAELQEEWRRQPDGTFKLTRLQVGAFRPEN
jgi:hypothetical protein